MYYLCSENQGADQLRGYREADQRLCFCICRAARIFMGVGRYTPNAAVMGDMGWESVEVRQWNSIIKHWHRLRSMDTNRLNFKVFIWAARRGNGRFKNWCGRVLSQFQKCDIATISWI